MFELDGSEIEQRVVSELLVASDDRERLDEENRQALHHKERVHQHAQLSELWGESGIDATFEEVENTMGSTWMDSYEHPLVRVPSFMSYAVVPRPVKLGARTIECSRMFEDSTHDVVGLHGKLLFYRTVEIANKEDGYTLDRKEAFHDAGFYSFLLHIKDPQSGVIVPRLVYGDVDAADWGKEGFKINFVQDVLQKKIRSETDSLIERLQHRIQGHDVSEERVVLASLLGRIKKRKWNLKQVELPGVLRQNEQPYLQGADEALQYELRSAMQQFIENYYEPKLTAPAVRDEAERMAREARLQHELTGGLVVTHFDIASAALRSTAAKRGHSSKQKGVQPIQFNDQSLFRNYTYDYEYRQALNDEAEFPFAKKVRSLFMDDGFEYQYALRDLIGNKTGAALRDALLVSELTAQQLKLCRSKMSRYDIYGKQRVGEEIANLESK